MVQNTLSLHILDLSQLPLTFGFVRLGHLRLTLFKRGDVISVTQKLLTTSLVVTCDSVNSSLGNHMKCFNKVIFSNKYFLLSREKVACFFMSADYIKMDSGLL